MHSKITSNQPTINGISVLLCMSLETVTDIICFQVFKAALAELMVILVFTLC